MRLSKKQSRGGVRARRARLTGRVRLTGLESLEERTLLAAPTVIDLMVVYDAGAKTQLALNDAQIQHLIRQSVDAANQVHYNTQDNIVLRLVASQQVTYTSSGNINTDLARLKTPGDGFLDEVQTLRNANKADLVSLISTPSFNGGLAYLLDDVNRADKAELSYSVLNASAIGPDSFVLAHETGHNLGAGHERGNTEDPSVGPFPYSYGYFFTANGVEYKDIMSYRHGDAVTPAALELPYFANPNLSFKGQPLGKPSGDPQAADLFATFQQTAPIVAGYRAGTLTDSTAPVATLYQTELNGTTLTFTVRYQDDISVNAATLDSHDVYVHTPEGFDLSAELVSLDRAGDGYAKLATYRVTLPASKPPLSSLTYFVRAGEVKDLSNNATPAGAIAVNLDFDVDKFAFASARDTGVLAAPTTRRVTGNLADSGDKHDMYKFTVNQQTAVSVALTGLSSEVTMFLMTDLNGNEDFDGGGEQITGTPLQGNANDRSISRVLSAGTYYVLIQQEGVGTSSPYTLTFKSQTTATDTTPPTAIADVADVTVATNTFSFSVIYSDENELDAQSIAVLGVVRVDLPGGSSVTTGSPGSTSLLPDGRIVANYTITRPSTIATGTVTLSMYNGSFGGSASAVKDSVGNLLPTNTPLGTFRIANGSADVVPPAVKGLAAPAVLVPVGTTYDFVVTYQDTRGLSTASLDNSDILVSGPGGFSQSAQFQSFTQSSRGSLTYAKYRITPPGGSWEYHDNGTYTVSVVAAQVKDGANLAAPAGAIGTFIVHAPYPGDATGDDKVDFNDLVLLAQNYNVFGGRGYGGGDFTFDGSVDFNDLVLLAQNYNTMIAAPPVGGASVSMSESTAAALASVAGVPADVLQRAVVASKKKEGAVFSVKPVVVVKKVEPVKKVVVGRR